MSVNLQKGLAGGPCRQRACCLWEKNSRTLAHSISEDLSPTFVSKDVRARPVHMWSFVCAARLCFRWHRLTIRDSWDESVWNWTTGQLYVSVLDAHTVRHINNSGILTSVALLGPGWDLNKGLVVSGGRLYGFRFISEQGKLDRTPPAAAS